MSEGSILTEAVATKPTVRLHLGDCMEVLRTLDAGSVDAVVTDPPYGVAFKGKKTKSGRPIEKGYSSIDDSPEYIRSVVVPIIEECISKFGRVVVMPGIRNMWLYPKPDDVGGIYCPAGSGIGKWGFTCFQPVLFYGKCPYNRSGLGCRPNSISSTDSAEKNGHPCPKPIRWMRWLVEKAAVEGETVLDPFMGSGTTGVACAQDGRNFIGCEIDPAYFAIAKRRIDEASATLF